jgi:phosphoglycolate phosphatase
VTGGDETARRLLAHARALLLDFDGPVCSVFAGTPAHVVASSLGAVLSAQGHESPYEIATAKDPFDVLRYAASVGPEQVRQVEDTFTAIEVEAVPVATPTPGAHELIRAWQDSGRPLAIVSNNSAAAIGTYLGLHDLRHLVSYVAARTGPDTSQLKPEPHLLDRATTNLGVGPDECVLIGDSISDLHAARSAGVSFIGYANKPGKREAMERAGADAVNDRLSACTI